MILPIFLPILKASECQRYLQRLFKDLQKNKTMFLQEMAPYLLLSGKSPQDLGFMDACQDMQSALYSVAEVTNTTSQKTNITFYQGICFTNQCPSQQLNNYKDLFIFLLNNSDLPISFNLTLNFVSPKHQLKSDIGPLILLSVLATVLVLMAGAYSCLRWTKLCFQQSRQGDEFVRLQFQVPQNNALRKLSMEHKFQKLFQEQNSSVPAQVSLLAFLALPVLILAQEFLLQNHFALNLQHVSSMFPSLASFISILAFYLPDCLLFLSGLHLSKPKTRLSYLFLMYLFSLLFLMSIKSLKLQNAPLWYTYNRLQCDWVNQLLMVGGNCPWLGFFPRSQIVGISIGMLTMSLGQRNMLAGLGVLAVSLIVSFAAMLIQERGLPYNFDSLQNKQLFQYYSKTSAHIFFYLLGLLFAMLKPYLKVLDKMFRNFIFRMCGLALLLGACALVGLVPWVWNGAKGFQFTIARLGFVLMSIPFFGRSLLSTNYKKMTRLNKLSHLSYPTLLVSSALIGVSVAGVQGLTILSTRSLFFVLLGELPLTLLVGVFVWLLTDIREAMPEQL